MVTGQAPQTQTLIDRKVYTVTKDLQSHFGTAADLLNNIPSVIVDTDGNVSVRNDSNVTILIDGKPSSQFSGSTGGLSLLQIPASDIERIEIMTTPPASVKAAGSGGVINIIMKKHRQAGFSGSARASLGEENRFVVGGDIAYNAGPLKSALSVGLRQDVKNRLTKDARVVEDPSGGQSTTSGERIDETVRRLVPSVKASVSYAPDDKQTIGASFSHRNLVGARHFLQQDDSGPTGQIIDSISDRLSRGHEWDAYRDEALTYDRQLGSPDEMLSLSLDRSIKRENEKYDYQNDFFLPVASPTFDTLKLGLDFQEIDFAADYARSFGSIGALKIGYDLDANNNLFDNAGANIIGGVAVIDPTITNMFRYRNQVDAAYGEFDDSFDDWHVDAGLRYETNRAATLLITGNVPGQNNDSGVYPSFHIQRSLSDEWNLLANAGRRITRPDPEALNPFVDTQDTQNLRAGNASLLPQDTWLYELGYEHSGEKVNFGSTVYYRFDRNSITDVVEPISSDAVLIQKENLPKTHSFGLEFQTDGKLTPKFDYSLSGNAFYMQIDARALGATGLESTAGINFKIEGDYRIALRDFAQITFARTDRRLTPQGTLGAVNVLNVGFKHEIDAGTYLVATVSDLLNGQGLHRIVGTPQLQDNYLRLQYGRIFYLGIVHGFGAPLGKKADEINYDQ
ncbi:MAG TPA: TonB-dependent receptor [Rhizomicrobium sp.]|nr:TonB-dependent receptor [Rhizomicrobium sp.]